MKKFAVIILCLMTMFCFMGCGNNNEYDDSGVDEEYIYDNSDEEAIETDITSETELIEEQYPTVWMREENLSSTKLGTPVSIELCFDFKSLRPERQYKTYKWGEWGKPNSGKATVEYVRHFSNKVDDYVTYTENNGYVSWVQYIDENGNLCTEDERDLHEAGIYQ